MSARLFDVVRAGERLSDEDAADAILEVADVHPADLIRLFMHAISGREPTHDDVSHHAYQLAAEHHRCRWRERLLHQGG